MVMMSSTSSEGRMRRGVSGRFWLREHAADTTTDRGAGVAMRVYARESRAGLPAASLRCSRTCTTAPRSSLGMAASTGASTHASCCAASDDCDRCALGAEREEPALLPDAGSGYAAAAAAPLTRIAQRSTTCSAQLNRESELGQDSWRQKLSMLSLPLLVPLGSLLPLRPASAAMRMLWKSFFMFSYASWYAPAHGESSSMSTSSCTPFSSDVSTRHAGADATVCMRCHVSMSTGVDSATLAAAMLAVCAAGSEPLTRLPEAKGAMAARSDCSSWCAEAISADTSWGREAAMRQASSGTDSSTSPACTSCVTRTPKVVGSWSESIPMLALMPCGMATRFKLLLPAAPVPLPPPADCAFRGWAGFSERKVREAEGGPRPPGLPALPVLLGCASIPEEADAPFTLRWHTTSCSRHMAGDPWPCWLLLAANPYCLPHAWYCCRCTSGSMLVQGPWTGTAPCTSAPAASAAWLGSAGCSGRYVSTPLPAADEACSAAERTTPLTRSSSAASDDLMMRFWLRRYCTASCVWCGLPGRGAAVPLAAACSAGAAPAAPAGARAPCRATSSSSSVTMTASLESSWWCSDTSASSSWGRGRCSTDDASCAADLPAAAPPWSAARGLMCMALGAVSTAPSALPGSVAGALDCVLPAPCGCSSSCDRSSRSGRPAESPVRLRPDSCCNACLCAAGATPFGTTGTTSPLPAGACRALSRPCSRCVDSM
mmetsp:Transcript_474/g.1260  ORF Transcript_474/g.1260 Transcript_474/m.1260 type:complete len:716 (-) Transcript_474:973-3120(-)